MGRTGPGPAVLFVYRLQVVPFTVLISHTLRSKVPQHALNDFVQEDQVLFGVFKFVFMETWFTEEFQMEPHP